MSLFVVRFPCIEFSRNYLLFPGQFGNGLTTNIQGIRLRNSNIYENQGRVEILYYNTWGTICDTYWGLPDGRVACR